MDPWLTIFAIFLAFIVVLFLLNFRKIVITEFECGLLFVNGQYKKTLQPGAYFLYLPGKKITRLDMRSTTELIAGQEILTADNLSVRISLGFVYRIADPYQSVASSSNPKEELHLIAQALLRDRVGLLSLEDLLKTRRELGDQLLEGIISPARSLGYEAKKLLVRDITFSRELRDQFNQVVNARNEGLAALERARGETAALRNLANAAKLMEGNPALYQLRLIEALEKGRGHTIILNPDPTAVSLTQVGKNNSNK